MDSYFTVHFSASPIRSVEHILKSLRKFDYRA